MIACRFTCAEYTVEFMTSAKTDDARRAIANQLCIKRFGKNPVIPYAEPGTPFPEYANMLIWNDENQAWLIPNVT